MASTPNTRSEFINQPSSEKLILAHIHANRRIINWTLDSGSIYKRTLPNFVNAIKVVNSPLTQVFTQGAVIAGTFYFDIETSTAFIELSDSSNPVDNEIIIQFRFFFSNAGISTSWNLGLTDKHVYYDGRILKTPGYNHKIGIEQNLSSVVGTGLLELESTDGALDELYDRFIFENQELFIYSWNRHIPIDQAEIIYRGRVTNKTFDINTFSFTVKDQLFDLLQTLPQDVYTDLDNVNDSILGQIKRWIYGRVDGLKLQSVDQIGNGYSITGTVSGVSDTFILTGIGTLFLAELSPNDTLFIDTLELIIDTIESDTSLTLTAEPSYAFLGLSALVKPDISTTIKNRIFFVAGHATAKLTKIVVDIKQFNRVILNDTIGLKTGDFVEFSTGERIEIKTVAPGNIIVLRKNLIQIPSISTAVIRQPVQRVFFEGTPITSENFTIANTPTDTKITLTSTVEFDLAKTRSLNVELAFINGSRNVSTTDAVDLRDIVKPRDFIRPTDITFTTFYEVLSVDEQSLKIRTIFTDPTHTGASQGRLPKYIGDDSILSADVLGRTVDNTASGTWLETAPDIILDILGQLNITNIDISTFTEAALDAPQLISLTIPFNPSSTLTTGKNIIDKLNKTIIGALTLNNDLDLLYKVLLVESADDLIVIQDSDIQSWKIKATNGKTFRNSVISYRHQDIIRDTLESGSFTATFSSEFVEKYIGTNNTNEIDAFLYNTSDAEILSHRDIFINQLGRATIELISDLKLENIDIGDVVVIDIRRLYKRFGDESTRKKLAYVIGKKKTGQEIIWSLSDLNNTFNQAGIIAPNTTNDFTSATEDEKLKFAFITDSNGIVDDDEDTAGINLIT